LGIFIRKTIFVNLKSGFVIKSIARNPNERQAWERYGQSIHIFKMVSPAKSLFGEFTPVYYERVHNKQAQSLGMNMYMEFKPGERVINATKIGFTQATKTLKNNKPQFNTENEEKE
jgi:hypothetical protein